MGVPLSVIASAVTAAASASAAEAATTFAGLLCFAAAARSAEAGDDQAQIVQMDHVLTAFALE